ncbi:MAG: transposase [Planctomycetaceae bacterium]|nr:transposase [Planctomycetaceae bacterium]
MNDAYSDPLAYFLTWTTYGSWLPGDERGWVGRTAAVRAPEMKVQQYSRSLQKQEKVVLNNAQRESVHQSIVESCERREWNILALNVRTNHVHLVIEAHESPHKVMSTLKRWSSHALNDHSEGSQKWWTKSGSRRILYRGQDVENAITYTIEGQ